ncbi:MAG: DUF2085 domain-containing protein, partial [Anaerolineales bacterium]
IRRMQPAAAKDKPRVSPLYKFVAAGVFLLLLGWLLNTPPGLLGKADALGYAVCHRIDLRSFHLGERQLPLCARCTGMYLGAMGALVFQLIVGRRRTGMPSKIVLIILAVMVSAFVLDGGNSFLSLIPGVPILYQPANWLRLLTGTGMGIVISVALFPGFNQTVWKYADSRAALGSLKVFSLLIGLGLLLDLLVLSGNPLILYPLALVSAAGVLVLLTMVYSMVWVLILHTENRYIHISQMFLPMIGGFGFALLQIILLDLGRYLLTGTWDGFHLG